jgi:hypothetical protein
MMNLTGEQRIFRREYNGKVYYSTGISKKDMNTNTYTSEYMPVSFKKGVDIPNKTDIIIKNSFLTFDKYKKEGEEKQTVIWKLFVMDYELKNELEFESFDSFEDTPDNLSF